MPSPLRTASPARRAATCVLLATLLLSLAAWSGTPALGASLGEGNALGELAQSEAETTTTPTTTTSTTTESSNSKSTILIAIVASVVVLLGIAFVIVRDARRVAPAGEGDVGEGRPARDPATALRKRRAKAKAARRQRKRNR